MSQTTVRITEETRDILKDLAKNEGRSMQAVLNAAISAYRRVRYIEGANRGWDRVREEPGEWKTIGEDLTSLERTIADGLPTGEVWTDDGEEISGRSVKKG